MEDNEMRVLQIVSDYLGTELYVTLFNALGEIGINNVIFVPINGAYNYRKENDSLRYDNRSSLVISQCFNSLDRLMFFSKQRKIYSGIKCSVDLKNIGCVHAHTLFSAGYTAMRLKENDGIPYIVAVRNVDVNVFFRKMIHLRKTGLNIMRNAQKIVFLSPAYREKVLSEYVPLEMKQILQEKSIVIPNGISSFFLDNRSRNRNLIDNTIRIVYVGEVNRNKNVEETVKACKLLKNQGFDCRYTIVGNVTDKSCRLLLQEDFIDYHKRCGHDELIKLYRKNDIFVMPSHKETFGLVYAEAMSQGLPVIYTRGQGFDGHFEEGEVGYSVSDKDFVELAEKIMKITKNYEKISRKCVEKASIFDWNNIAEKYKNLYCKITNG